ncbi:hypothetical protein RchiOBHm_Chr4g0402231 [Rosa chinensis]|uniref:Uncharacterized protein n=1 Tax=Rosa chinensis TaxID=74649 RepID=A0A2P6QT90_ROSCH|nr:hypothetical protein RchiOBHm_Chr4g0402231 [Rosa chinensis]
MDFEIDRVLLDWCFCCCRLMSRLLFRQSVPEFFDSILMIILVLERAARGGLH